MRISDWSSDVCSSDLNIMLTRDGVPKLMDFSIAEINPAGRAGTQGGQSVLGSPLYMSPEHITREALGPASDLYSLGAVMFQLLVGTAPFNNPELPLLFRAIRNQPAPGVRELRSEEHTSELQSLMGISYAVFCLK